MENKVLCSTKLDKHKYKGKKVRGDDLDAINQGLQDLKIEHDWLRIVTMNMGYGHKRTPVTSRRTAAELVAESDYPHILFTQEIAAASSPFWMMDVKDSYQCKNTGKEAGLMWDTDRVEFREEISMDKKDTVIQSMSGKSGRQWTADALSELAARSCIVCLKLSRSLQYVMVVSWHGMWRKSVAIRLEALQALQEFVWRVRERYFGRLVPKPPIIIGGDFNLPLEKWAYEVDSNKRPILDERFILPSYEPSVRRTLRVGDETIDFFLHTAEITVKDTAPLEMLPDTGSAFNRVEVARLTPENLDSMDHDPVKAYAVFTPMAFTS